MLKAPFPKTTAILGIATGAIGIVLEILGAYIGPIYGIYGLLLPVWFVLAGLGLARQGRGSARVHDVPAVQE